MKLTDYLSSINHTKEPLMDTKDETIERGYSPFVINRCLSYFPDTIFHANVMNKLNNLSNKCQFDYLRTSLRKRKRFSKWLKNEINDDFLVVQEYYNYSKVKTREIFDILTKDQIEDIRRILDIGGVKKH
jgi:hypothetical protein|tara:strand:- start:3787 stop:4176 length:390 start_codon:yes stop_codon:yes gene_type:complete